MENSVHACASAFHHSLIGDVSFDDLERGFAGMLIEVGTTADDEVVEDPNAVSLFQQPINQMTANEASAPRYQIKHLTPQSPQIVRAPILPAPGPDSIQSRTRQ